MIPGVIAGGVGGSYHADAVHFETVPSPGSSYFVSDGLVTTDSKLGLISFFVRESGANADSANLATTLGGAFWNISVSNATPARVSFDCWDTTNSVEFSFHAEFTQSTAWHSILIGVDTNHGAGLKIGKITVDRVPLVVTVDHDSAAAFNIGWSQDATSTVIGSVSGSNDGIQFDIAEFYMAMGQYADVADSAVIAKFVDGSNKPVNLGSNGSTPTGTVPTIYFKGTAASYPNSGTSGTFTKTLSGSGAFTNASTSPSD